MAEAGVLRLVQDDAGAVQRPAAHVGQRGDLDGPVGHELVQLAGRDHVLQRVVQRLEIRVQLVLEVAGQEAQALPRLHGRPREDDPLDLAVLQRPDGQGDGDVRLARSGRAHGEHEVVVEIGLHEFLLRLVTGADGLPVRPVDDDRVAREAELLGRGGPVEDVLHVIHRQVHLPVPSLYQFPETDLELLNVALAAFQDEFVAPRHHFQVREIGTEFGEDLVAGAVEFNGIYRFQRNGFLHRFSDRWTACPDGPKGSANGIPAG